MSTDHKAESVASLDIAGEYPFGHDDEERRERYHLAAAQVHATLALVEELRTANLIAMTAADMSAGYGIPSSRLDEIASRLP